MKQNLTELVFILDRSGSMSGLEKDVIGGFNSLIEKQRREAGEAKVTAVLFDDRYELIFDRSDLKTVAPLSEKEYYVRGCTALLDAVGKTITDEGRKLFEEAEENRPERVLFVITTDGYENASREYSFERVRSMIEHQKSKYSWEFLFLGANIDAEKAAESIGIDRSRAANFVPDEDGVKYCIQKTSDAVAQFCMGEAMPNDWKAEIDADFCRRGKKSRENCGGGMKSAKRQAPKSEDDEIAVCTLAQPFDLAHKTK